MSISGTTFFATAVLLLFGPLDRIQKAFDKADYEKVVELIDRGKEKEPQNPGFTYFQAKLLFTEAFSGYDPDSARIIVNQALEQYSLTDSESREELAEDGVSQDVIDQLSADIRQYLFQGTLSTLSIDGVNGFLRKYPGSRYEALLIHKRDSMVFRRVRRADTKEGYLGFISNYPSSSFRPAADSLLDQLRYLDLVNTGSLRDYESFRTKFPATNRLREVEEYILKVATASHASEDLKHFIATGRIHQWRKRAADVLYFLTEAGQESHPMRDSLAAKTASGDLVVFPVMDHEKFGFHSRDGSPRVPYAYDRVQEQVKCSTTQDRWIFAQLGSEGLIVLKDGSVLLENVDGYESISEALALVERNGYRFLYHKSGFRIIEDPVESAEVLNHGWIRVARNGKSGLYTLLGLPIAEVRYDDIFNLGPFWVFEREGQLGVYTTPRILDEVESRGLDLEFKFDDLELVNDSLLIGYKGARECLLDLDLNFLIPWGEYEIHPDPLGWYVRSEEGYYLYNNTDDRIISTQYKFLESSEHWLALESSDDWLLIPRQGPLNPMRGYDSVKLIEPAALLFQEGKQTLAFSSGTEISLDGHEVRSFSGRNDFLLIKKDGALGLYNETGEAVFDGKYDELAFVNDSLLKVTINDLHGIIHTNGEFLLNPIFETLDVRGDLIITLYKGLIGCYDLSKNLLIPPVYESRVERIGDGYRVRKEGKYGLIDANSEQLIDFNFEGIETWNDTSVLVLNEGLHAILTTNEDTLMHSIEKLELLVASESEQIYKFVQEGKFGLLSNLAGILLNPEYTDIFNIGSQEEPLFFADQHLSHAGFHVVSYVDAAGTLIFSKAYNREEFDRILCDDY